ncbi:hypothetical protein RMATCC62417_00162 [Rhizopus microsporus]|nr:hypothetical protein RMATCC62417_00162 [Rhizopus microsporus]
MKGKILVLLKLIILLISVATLTCHIGQIVLLLQMEDTGNWWPDYVPFTLYYVGPIVSTLSVNTLIFLLCLRYTLVISRVVGVINVGLLTAVVAYNTTHSGTIPWLGAAASDFRSDAKGWVPYCGSYSYLNTSLRCYLINGAWLGCVILLVLWTLLTIYVCILRDSTFYHKDDYDNYDFKDDVPMVYKPSDYPGAPAAATPMTNPSIK